MKNNDLEYNICREYTELPDEFRYADTDTVKQNNSKKPLWKKMIYMVAALSIIVYKAIIPFDLDILASSEDSSQLQVSEGTDLSNGQSQQGSEGQQENGEPKGDTPLPVLPIYPLEDDVISFITIYNDSIDPVSLDSKIVSRDFITYAILGESGYAMPAYEPQDGFVFMGWVVYYDKNMETGPSLGKIENVFTGSDYLHIKPQAGSRPVEIHAAWRNDGISKWANMLTLNANGGTIEGSSLVTYDARTPMGSAGKVYLCAYPVPVRDGYTFAGWYAEQDCSGKQCTLLYGADFYERTKEGIDWSSSKPITLYAGWVKN